MKIGSLAAYEWMVRTAIRRSVRTGLRGVWVRGAVPSGGAVIAPSHASWWDGYVLRELAWQIGQPFTVLMTGRQLANFPFLRFIGAIGDQELRPALRSLGAGHWLLVFPEAQIEPLGPLGKLQPGAAWLAQKSGAPLYPAALRVVMRGQTQPEAYLRFGAPVSSPELEEALRHELKLLDAELASSDPEQPLAGYLRMVGSRSFRADTPSLSARMLARLTRDWVKDGVVKER
ncbi:lysophospholipid acyltransferase family protein [Deinococcus sp.]|uniref:lysophospholipid acyltransferase family protein n=1 Tax=Deinococcus sp. TaxID=47478 RepID=UPI0025E5794A|nr:lysophospholipid acyltransferase family protein [Deinococcus sp.]